MRLRNWFFLRYADPQFHLRVRVNVGPDDFPKLAEVVRQATLPAATSGLVSRIVYDTYLPEIERYGGPEAITLAESIFSVDSDASLALLCDIEEGRGARTSTRELAVLAGIDRMLLDAEMPRDECIDVLERKLGRVSSSIRRSRGHEYREHRLAVVEALERRLGDQRVASLLNARSARMRPLLGELRRLWEAGVLQAELNEILFSLSHMWINRTLTNAITRENVLYDWLQRAYRGLEARSRIEASTT